MKRTVNMKIVWLSLLLVAIIFASTTFGTFEPFVGSAPGIGNTGIGAGAMMQKAKANSMAMPNAMAMPMTTTEGFRARPRVYRGGYY